MINKKHRQRNEASTFSSSAINLIKVRQAQSKTSRIFCIFIPNNFILRFQFDKQIVVWEHGF